MGGQREGRGAEGEEEREVGRRTEGAPIEIMLPNPVSYTHLTLPTILRV